MFAGSYMPQGPHTGKPGQPTMVGTQGGYVAQQPMVAQNMMAGSPSQMGQVPYMGKRPMPSPGMQGGPMQMPQAGRAPAPPKFMQGPNRGQYGFLRFLSGMSQGNSWMQRPQQPPWMSFLKGW